MAAAKLAPPLLLLCACAAILAPRAVAQETSRICPVNTYSPDESFEFCYLYVQSNEDYFAANRSCVRDGAVLVDILSASENELIRTRYYEPDQQDFWIGLNDINRNGAFRWNSDQSVPEFFQWSSTSPGDDSESFDCVKFTAAGRWQIHQDFCGTSRLPFLCKMRACDSQDGVFCIGQEPTLPPSPGLSTGAVVAIIVVILVLAIVIAIVVILVCLWKFKNDVFYRYICCCVGGGARSTAMHSLQQENQRLRHELSQNKVSLGGSGRYSQGQFGREISGVPDGKGGVLPPLKPSLGTALSPTIPENRPISFSTTQPPPLNVQRYSRVTPVNKPPIGATTPTFFTGHRFLRQTTAPGSLPLPKQGHTAHPAAPVDKQPTHDKDGDDATSTGSSSSSSLSDKQVE